MSWLFRTINVTQPIIRAEGTTRGPGHSVTGSRGVAWNGRGDEGASCAVTTGGRVQGAVK